MIRTEEKEICGHKITVTTYTGREGINIFAKLGRIIGPMFSGLGGLDGLDLTKVTDSELAKAMLPMICKIFEALPETEYAPLLVRILRSTRLDGKEITPEIFDIEFAGEYALLLQTVAFVLTVNYKSFFGESGIGLLHQYRQNIES